MAWKLRCNDTDGVGKRHPTTRRGFITGLGFGVVSLYGLWAVYGAAPVSLGFLSEGSGSMANMKGMHGGDGGMSPEEFRRLTEEFIEANRLADGSVKPGHGAVAARIPRDGHEDDDHGAMAQMTTAGDGDQGTEVGPIRGHGAEEEPIDVYVMASRYGYEPGVLRLDVKVPYKFKFMAVDADHGASINLRFAGHMIRCPAKTLAVQTLAFTSPGEYLVYCTVYCGEGHDLMMGKIIVA